MSDPLANTRAAIRNLQAGNPPNGIEPGDCGIFADIIGEACRAYELSGTEAAMRVLATEPELIRLASEDDIETPATLTNAETWLSTDEIMAAFHRGETGDAELLAALYAGRLAYDHAEKQWYLWNGCHWQADRTRQAGNLVANHVAAQYIHAAAEKQRTAGDDKEAQEKIKELWRRAGSLRYRGRINNVLALAASQPALALTGDEWEQNPMLLAVANGIIDLDTGHFMPGNPADYIRAAAPALWQGLGARAPRWEQFLREIFAGDAELIAFMQRLLGYAITGQTTEHVLPILWGKGRNGKETLLETLRNVLGDLAAPASKDVLMDSNRNPGSATPHLYALRHLRLAWVSESKAGATLNVEQVKWLTGGGTLTARPLHGNPVTFTPRYLLLLITNHKPKADADDYALWKRLLLIPFTQSFINNPKLENEHKADPRLAGRLKAEAPGILAWLVNGCLAWQREGLNPPPSVRLATEAYQQEEDDLSQFVEECCLVGPDKEVKASDLYKTYKQWAESYGMKPTNNTVFGKRMSKRFEKRLSGGVIYSGIGLLVQDSNL